MSHCPPLRSSLLVVLLLGLGCDDGGSDEAAPPRPLLGGELPYETLSEYGFFVGEMAAMEPTTGVVPYQVAAPLWADHAGKDRFIVLPEGSTIEVDGAEAWSLPSGSVVIKSFFYSKDRRAPDQNVHVVETRLLIHEAEGWTGHVYVWNEAQTEAVRKVAGGRLRLEFLDDGGQPAEQSYVLPNTNQCKNCHENDDVMGLLGPVTRQLARPVKRGGEQVDQLDWLASQGLFAAGAPSVEQPLVDPFGDADLDLRARSYLESNCGHCHRSGGHGGASGLVLLASEERPSRFGVCKSPVAAGTGSGGRLHDIAPGRPEDSILVYRMESTDPKVKMPEIPNLLPHQPGIDLVSEWISAMTYPACL